MNAFASIIERKQSEADKREAILKKENEVKNFLKEVARSYESDLLEIFDRKIVDFVDFPSYCLVKVDGYRVDVHKEYGKNSGNYIRISYGYSHDYNATMIPFSYDMNKSKLTSIVKNAMMVLVKKAYRTK